MKIAFQGSRADIRLLVYRLAGMLSGREPDTLGVGRWFLIALGFGALSDIKDAFIVKSRGGTDEMGIKWPPLKPETIANRRLGPEEKKIPILKLREQIRKRLMSKSSAYYKLMMPRLLLSLSPEAAQARYKQMVGRLVTDKLEWTKVQLLGGRDVEILRDSGVLFNSLSPGVMSRSDSQSASYKKPVQDGGSQQIFELRAGSVSVGTNVLYAAAHNYGHPKRPTLPRRQFLPESGDQVPDIWWQRWLDIAMKGFDGAAATLFKQAG